MSAAAKQSVMLLLATAFAAAASAQTTYRVVPLSASESISVDSHGKVFAWAGNRDWLCSQTRCRELPKQPQMNWTAINDSQTLAGYTMDAQSDYWMVRKPKGQPVALLAPGFGLGVAQDGTVVGSDRQGNAMVFTDQAQVLPGVAGLGGTALAINGSHVVVGSSVMPDSGYHATKWTDGVPEDLGVLTGGTLSMAYAVNETGTAVGFSYGGAHGGQPAAVRFSGGAIQELTMPDGVQSSVAYSINSKGRIVGVMRTAEKSLAGLAEGDAMVDLNERIGSDDRARYRLWYASSINDKGQIAAIAYEVQFGREVEVAVRLDPVK